MAMARGCPDRVPLMCQLALGHYFLHAGSDPVEIWHDSEAFAEALVTLQRRYGFDGILVNLPGRDPEWRRSVRTVEAVDAMPGGQCVRWMTGEVTLVPADESPRVTGPDGLRRRPRFEEVDPGRLFYFEPHDLPGSRDPGCETFPPWQDRTLRRVRELAGPEVSVHAEMFSPLSQMLEMVDPEDGLMALALDEGKVRAVLDAP